MDIRKEEISYAFSWFIKSNKVRSVVVFYLNKEGKPSKIKITRKYRKENDFIVTIGRPNYTEKLYLKKCEIKSVNPAEIIKYYTKK